MELAVESEKLLYVGAQCHFYGKFFQQFLALLGESGNAVPQKERLEAFA